MNDELLEAILKTDQSIQTLQRVLYKRAWEKDIEKERSSAALARSEAKIKEMEAFVSTANKTLSDYRKYHKQLEGRLEESTAYCSRLEEVCDSIQLSAAQNKSAS